MPRTVRRPLSVLVSILVAAAAWFVAPSAYASPASPAGATAVTAVTGRMVTPAGDPLLRTGYVTFYTSGSVHVGQLRTDPQGRFDTRTAVDSQGQPVAALRSLPAGTYRVHVSPDGSPTQVPWYQGKDHTLTVGAGAVLDRNLAVSVTPVVRFTVLDAAGQPVPNPDVAVKRRLPAQYGGDWGNPQSGPWTYSDAQGHVVVSSSDMLLRFLPPAGSGLLAEYWDGPAGDGAYAHDDAVPLTVPQNKDVTEHTVRLGTSTTVKPGTPTVSGEVAMGSTLVADPGDWGPAGVELEYQWLNVLGVKIPGATERELTIGPDTPVADGFGPGFSVRVTGRVAGSKAVDAESATVSGTIDPAGAPPVTYARPTVSGTTQVGETLTAAPGAWGPSGVQLAYQWFADGAAVPGATTATLALAGAHEGKRMSVRVTGSLAGYATVARTSAATTAVRAVPTVEITAGTPTVSGSARAGRTLTAQPGTWTPGATALTYEWLADGDPVHGATSTTLRLTNALARKRISVRVTGTHADAETVTATSAPTAAVVGMLTGAVPKVTGKAKVGRKLTAKPGAWSPRPVTLKYQWLRNGKVVKGATRATYKLSAKDRGKRVSVRVTGVRAGYATLARTSGKTAAVKR